MSLPWKFSWLAFRQKYGKTPQHNQEKFEDGQYGNCRALDSPTSTYFVPEPSHTEPDTGTYFKREANKFLYDTTIKGQSKAKGLCETCPVQNSCLSHAYDNPNEGYAGSGVWGGKTAEERNKTRLRLKNPTTLDDSD